MKGHWSDYWKPLAAVLLNRRKIITPLLNLSTEVCVNLGSAVRRGKGKATWTKTATATLWTRKMQKPRTKQSGEMSSWQHRDSVLAILISGECRWEKELDIWHLSSTISLQAKQTGYQDDIKFNVKAIKKLTVLLQKHIWHMTSEKVPHKSGRSASTPWHTHGGSWRAARRHKVRNYHHF